MSQGEEKYKTIFQYSLLWYSTKWLFVIKYAIIFAMAHNTEKDFFREQHPNSVEFKNATCKQIINKSLISVSMDSHLLCPNDRESYLRALGLGKTGLVP